MIQQAARILLRHPVVCSLIFVSCTRWGIAQATKPPQQPLYLPDPTPRQRDLSHNLPGPGTNAEADAVRREQALTRQRGSRARMIADVDAMIALADQLRQRASLPDSLPAAPLDRMAGQKIERLVKDVRVLLGVQ